MNTTRNADRAASVTVRLTGRQYRDLVRELEFAADALKREYSENASHWGDTSPDRIAFANRLQRLRELVAAVS